MDFEEQDSFKTIPCPVAKPQTGLSKQPSGESSKSPLDQASCLARAKAIFGCYRRDEAHDPEGFVAALAAILGDYPANVVNYAADPRTGVACEYPMGLPNIGQIRGLLDIITRRLETLSKRDERIAKPYVPPPTLPGQIDSTEFARRVKAGELKHRPIGRFETAGDEWNRGIVK